MSDVTELPKLNITEEETNNSGFTTSGATRFKETVEEYSNILFNRSIQYAEVDKAPNLPREVTHDHVRAAAHSIANTYGRPAKSKWLIPAQIFEYLAAATAGAGASHLDASIGVFAFGLGLTVAVIIIVVRLTKFKGD